MNPSIGVWMDEECVSPNKDPEKRIVAYLAMRIIFFILAWGVPIQLFPQEHLLVLKGDDLPEGISLDRSYRSEIKREDALNKLLRISWKKGFLAASLDSTRKKGDTLIADYYRGVRYEWGNLEVAGKGKGMILAAGIDTKRMKGQRIDPEGLSKLFEKVLQYCEQNGYPFARVGLDSIEQRDSGLTARLHLDKGPMIRLDTLVIKGDDAVHRNFLSQYLGLEKGMLYDEKVFEKIDGRLKNLSFLDPSKPSELLFTEEGVSVYLYISEREASRFNGMVGLQPDEENGGVVLTGDLTLGLKNALGRGEGIELDWNRMQVSTQDLSVGYEHPYLLRTPFGIEAGLKLYRKDSAFTELKQRLALKYLFSGEDHFQVHYQRKRWNLLEGGERDRQADLPFASLRVDAYGLGFERSAVDRRYLPRNGVRGELDGSVGRKELTGDRPSFLESNEKVDSSGKALQYELEGSVEAFHSLTPRLILMGGFQGAFLQAPYLVENELYRIGGHGSLRGVDKEVIRASAYAVGTFEFRYLLESESDLHLFFDAAYHEDRSGAALSLDRPFGFGVGSRFKTGAGIFNIDYALGKRFDNPIRLQEGRIHFGFTSLF